MKLEEVEGNPFASSSGARLEPVEGNPFEQAAPASAKGYAAAALRGIARDIPFAQDIGAGLDVARSYLGDSLAPRGVPTTGTPGERFDVAKQRQKATDEYLEKNYPLTTLGSQVAGAFALPMAGPASRVSAAVEPLVGGAAARSIGLGTVGAGYGGLYGLGSGDTADERLRSAGAGALAGGVGGAAVPFIADKLGRGASWSLEKLGFGNPSKIAARQAAAGFERAGIDDTTGMSLHQMMEAERAGQPVLPIDIGGQNIKAAAKTAANFSPEARGVLISELATRAEQQAPRVYDFAEKLIGKRLDDPNVAEDIRRAASAVNTPAYAAAMAKGSGGVWNPTLERLINHPWIRKALPQAIEESNADAIAKGLPAMKNPFVTDPATGNLTLPAGPGGTPVAPTLEFWDVIKKNLDSQIRGATPTATSRGDPNTVRIGGTITKALTNQLDALIPEYKAARLGAGRYLGEESAYAFGPKFLKATSAQEINKGAAAIQKFTPEEREYAQHSYMAERIQKYLNRPKNQDVAKMFSSPAMKAKDVAILGEQKANEFEAYMLREGLMNNSLSSLNGSDTARNAIAAARWAADHGIGVFGGAGAGVFKTAQEGDYSPLNMIKNIGGGAAAGLFAQRGLHLGEKAAVELAKQLVSDDPAIWRPAIEAIAGHPRALQSLRNAYSGSVALASRSSAEIAKPSKQAEVKGQLEFAPQRASGGRVMHKARKLDAEASRTLKALGGALNPIMDMPDEAVANALRIAKHQ